LAQRSLRYTQKHTHTHTGLETPQERGKPKGKIKSFFSAAFGFVQKYSMVLTPAFFSVDPREKKQFGARYRVLEEVRGKASSLHIL
jgi:hypothetical protein